MKQIALAPETSAAVLLAQRTLEQEASRAEAINDPTAPTLRALSLAVGACHKLYVDGPLTIGSLLESARVPIEPDMLKRAIADGIRANASRAVRALNVWNVLIAASILVGSNMLTASIVCWWTGHKFQSTLTSLDVALSGSASQRWRSLIEANPGDLIERERGPCSAQNGSVACQFNLWTRHAAPRSE